MMKKKTFVYNGTRLFRLPEAKCFRKIFLSSFLLLFVFIKSFSQKSADSTGYKIDSTRNFTNSSIIHVSEGTTVYGNFFVTNEKRVSPGKFKIAKKAKTAKLVVKASKIYKNYGSKTSVKYNLKKFSATESSAVYAGHKYNLSQAVSCNTQDKTSECEKIVIFSINYLQIAYSKINSIHTSSASVRQKNYHSFCRPPPFQFSLNIS